MSTWYHRASWSVLRSLYSPRLLENRRVEASGLESLPDPPFVLMADHANELDAYVLGSFFERPVRYMANIEGVNPLAASFAELIGAYGRRKGATDLSAIRSTFAISRSGDSIGIFPEGDRSWDGSSSPLRPGAGRLARRLGVPLVLARQRGNYLAKPRWASRRRTGAWSVDFLVYGADELARMSDELVETIIATAVAKNEIKDALAEGRHFNCEGSAEGIERLLWRCPICGKADSIRGRGDGIGCCRCGSRWALDANCRVAPVNAPHSLHAAEIRDLKDWHDWQVATLPELASELYRGKSRLLSEGVVLSRREGSVIRRMGRGLLYLRGTGGGAELVFECDESRAVFEASAVRGFVDNFNAFSEFNHRGQRWRLEFGRGNSVKWAIALSGGRGLRGPEAAA